MKIIHPSFEIINQNYDDLYVDMLKHIEVCGRTCYKSEDKITDTSYQKFTDMLIKSDHGAMLEHGTVYLTIPIGTPVDDPQYMWKTDLVRSFQENPYSKVVSKVINQNVDVEIKGYGMRTQASARFYFITTNWRVIIENADSKTLKYFSNWNTVTETLKESVLQWMTPPSEEHERRYTVRFTCDIGVSREFNRHRKDSPGEESTRYCNYSKDKFGGELNYIEPVFLTDAEKEILNNPKEHLSLQSMCNQIGNGTYYSSFEAIDYFIFALEACEFSYINLIKLGWKPQQARVVLPLDTKTELVHTAYASDWTHFFNLRALGTTGSPHPSAKELAWPLMEEFFKREYISRNDINEVKYNYIIDKYPNIEDYIKL